MSNEKQNQLSQVVIRGYKSIKECKLDLKNINVLIGSNGAGKSNFVSMFALLQSINYKELDFYSQKKGVSSLFYNGPKSTRSIFFAFVFNQNVYSFKLELSEENRLVFKDESLIDIEKREGFQAVESGYANDERKIFKELAHLFTGQQQWRVYHFHDTGSTSTMKMEHNLSNSKTLMQDASNLAAFLYRLRNHYPAEYGNILKAIQLIAPYFKDFELEPMEYNRELIILRWLQKGCESVFNASQLSDGTLRFICLATLLLQPTELQPSVIIIDEPELGLHPFAIAIFAEMVQSAAVDRQIILATQSVELLDCFDVEDVVVVDIGDNGSEFKRLDAEQLKLWLENDYTLGELWNKNIFGGRP